MRRAQDGCVSVTVSCRHLPRRRQPAEGRCKRVPGEEVTARRAKVGGRQWVGVRVEEDFHAPGAQPTDAVLEGGMPCQSTAGKRHGDDGYCESYSLVEQAERKGVTGAVCPLVD